MCPRRLLGSWLVLIHEQVEISSVSYLNFIPVPRKIQYLRLTASFGPPLGQPRQAPTTGMRKAWQYCCTLACSGASLAAGWLVAFQSSGTKPSWTAAL